MVLKTVSRDQVALLQAVIANPDDDLPRLVYADWLEEHDQSERAQFIRLQCELAEVGPRTRRGRVLRKLERELFEQCRFEWQNSSHIKTYGKEIYRRGFLEYARVTAAGFLRHGQKLFR